MNKIVKIVLSKEEVLYYLGFAITELCQPEIPQIKERDKSAHRRVRNAYMAHKLVRSNRIAIFLCFMSLGFASLVFWSPTGDRKTIQESWSDGSGVFLYFSYFVFMIGLFAINLSRMQNVGSVGPVAMHLHKEWKKAMKLLHRGNILSGLIQEVTMSDQRGEGFYLKGWRKFVRKSLANLAEEVLIDEEKPVVGHRGVLERQLNNLLNLGVYIGLSDDPRVLRKEIFSEVSKKKGEVVQIDVDWSGTDTDTDTDEVR